MTQKINKTLLNLQKFSKLRVFLPTDYVFNNIYYDFFKGSSTKIAEKPDSFHRAYDYQSIL